ncbi:MAG: hypothetical protein R3301_10675 [Saprospiraceae bacterium]|nr:hypothetical protein [Saprospiraceae bacterium]
MRTTIALVVILLAIVGVVVFVQGDGDNDAQGYTDYEGDFAIKEIDRVHRVVLTHGDKRQFDLRRTSDGWTVNNLYKARMSSVEPLLEVIQRVDIKYIPPQAAMDYIIWDIGANAIKVEIFDRQDDLIKTYYVAGSTADERGTHMIMEGSRQPFVMHLPTMDGSFRARFTLGIDDWRDRHFMPMQPDEITRVVVEYPRQKSQSFILEADKGTYEVTPLYPDLRTYPDRPRSGAADLYLRALTGMACESYETNYAAVDSIRSLQPFSRIAIVCQDSTRNALLHLYPKGPLVHSEFSPAVHRFFVDLIPGDFMVAQHGVIREMLRGYDFFFEGEDQELIF